MTLKQQVQEDLTKSLKAKEELKVGTLRMLLASFINKEKNLPADRQDRELSEEELQQAVQTEAKKRREAAEAFEKADRQELASKEKQELEVLKAYLPELLAEEEIGKLARESIQETGAVSPQDIGKVMAVLMPKLKGKADGSRVNQIVKELLTG